MNESIQRWLRRVGLSLGAGAVGLLTAVPGWGQELPAPPPRAAAEADEGAVDRADAAQEARQETRETRRETRDAARDAAQEQREATRETRDEVQDAVEARREAGREREAVRDGDVAPNARTRVGESVEATRDARGDAREAARDAAANVREGARASVQANRQPAADFRVSDYRSADFGLWFDRAANQGLVISDVATSGMIADLGFTAGDRIVSINGRPVASEAEFMDFVFAPQFRDQRVQVIVDRDGAQETIVLEPSALIQEVGMVQEDALEELGIVLDDRYNDRALVWRVTRRSPAFYAGIRPGDTITAINRQQVATAEDAHQAAANIGDGPVVIQVSRGDRFRDVEVEVVPSQRREVRVEGELPAPVPPVTPRAAVPPQPPATPPAPPATPPATVVTPAQPAPNVVAPVEPRPNVVAPVEQRPNVTPRASRPVRPGLFPRLRQR